MASQSAAQWNTESVKLWLLQQGPTVATEEVLAAFAENGISGSDLLDLNAEDIRDELRIKNLGSRKRLLNAIEELRHAEGVKELKAFAPELRRCIQEDATTAGGSESRESSCSGNSPDGNDVKEVATLWDEEIARLEERLRDADFAAAVHSVELSHCRCSETDAIEAMSLNHELRRLQQLEERDAGLALEVHRAGSERTVQQILSRSAQQTTAVFAAHSQFGKPAGDMASSSSGYPTTTTQSPDYTGEAASSCDPIGSASPPGQKGGVPPKAKRRECVCCRDKKPRTIELPCKHIMCHDCLGTLFMNAATDASLWPVRCCKQRVDTSLARAVLSPSEFLRFADKLEEIQATNKMYCANPYCSHFINLDSLTGDSPQYSCPRCGTDVCTKCKSRWHPGVSCETWSQLMQIEDDTLLVLAGQKGWKRCEKCRHMVQLAHGCNHMTCRCGHHFCYQCGTTWLAPSGRPEQQCKCDLWTEANLVQEEQRRVAIVEHVERRRVAPVEREQIRAQIVAEECAHGSWGEIQRGWHGLNQECSNCGFHMKHYGFRCGLCRDMVCYTCRHHRLG